MTTISSATPTVQKGAGWLVRFGRLGYAVMGLVYLVVGFLAVKAAFGDGGGTTDVRGALRTIGQGPLGEIALVVLAAGFLGYAAWRFVAAVTDPERTSAKASRTLVRIGNVFRGFAYGALGVWTVRYLLGSGSGDSDSGAREITGRALSFPGGRWLVIAIGAGFVVYAAYQIYTAVAQKYLDHLDLSDAPDSTRTLIERLGGFGVGARAIVFGMIGVLIVRAGWNFNPSEAGGIEKSLDELAVQPAGHIVFTVVAGGLIAFGLLQIAIARYRVMRVA